MKTLALVDLSAIWWRNFMSTKPADPVDAAHGWTVGKVRRIASEYAHVAICCDAKTNWRRDLAPGTYKANRAARPPEAWAQLESVKETLRRDGFPLWCVDGYEADDIIASAVAQVSSLEDPLHVVVVSGDKDMLALVRDGDPSVALLTLGDPKNEPKILRAADCAIGGEKVAPNRVRDFLALVGDGSDNVRGVKGIGPKNAAKLLEAYGSFPGVINALEGQDARLMASPMGKLLAEQKDSAVLSWELVALKSDAPIDVREALAERKPLPAASPSETRGEARPSDDELDGDAEEGEPVSGSRTAPPVQATALATSGQTTALATVEPVPWSMQLEPTSSRGAWGLAIRLADSRMFPQLDTAEKCLAAILLGRIHNLPAAVACMGCAPIKGKMAMGSAMLIGIVQKHALCEYFECVDANDREATWVGKRLGRPERALTFTIEQAHRAGYTATRNGDGSWQKDPETMLYWRCGTRAARRWWPDVVAGVYSVEEMSDEERAA